MAHFSDADGCMKRITNDGNVTVRAHKAGGRIISTPLRPVKESGMKRNFLPFC